VYAHTSISASSASKISRTPVGATEFLFKKLNSILREHGHLEPQQVGSGACGTGILKANLMALPSRRTYFTDARVQSPADLRASPGGRHRSWRLKEVTDTGWLAG
jgi:hypothetical protein